MEDTLTTARVLASQLHHLGFAAFDYVGVTPQAIAETLVKLIALVESEEKGQGHD